MKGIEREALIMRSLRGMRGMKDRPHSCICTKCRVDKSRGILMAEEKGNPKWKETESKTSHPDSRSGLSGLSRGERFYHCRPMNTS
jgi:hypothetical protein